MTLDYIMRETPEGVKVKTPVVLDPQNDQYAATTDLGGKYNDNGVVILRNIIPQTYCDDLVTSFLAQKKKGLVKPYSKDNPGGITLVEGDIPSAMKGIFPNYFMRDVDEEFLEAFEKVADHRDLREAIEDATGKDMALSNANYYESTEGFATHRDLPWGSKTPYTTTWIALEDIGANTSRLFVYPGSHKHTFDFERKISDRREDLESDGYSQKLIGELEKLNISCEAPAMRRGDALFFTPYLVHGSLKTPQKHTRHSLVETFSPHYTMFDHLRQWRATPKTDPS